jgi:uncharacterized protein (DUF305 family)
VETTNTQRFEEDSWLGDLDSKSAMMKMMEAMPKFTGDADIDFMKQMRTHHEAAIDMAKVVLANGKDVDTKKLAEEIIAA